MITGKCILVKIMPSIQPWLYPNNPSVDRIAYIPLQSAHILQYQEEFVDAEGNVYWKTTDTTTISGAASVKEFLEQMRDYYETCSCVKNFRIIDHE